MKQLIILALSLFSMGVYAQYPYQNSNLTPEERAEDLVDRMTLDEKIGQMMDDAPAIDRLGIPKYNWWNECLHGVARSGYATVFPQSISIAASWDKDLLFDVATVISDEARAKHQEAVRRGTADRYQGLTFWSPNINIFRDPRWGRGHETYGEDPYLTGTLGTQFVKGLQGDDDKYLKLVATAKHYAVHSGPEEGRHSFDVDVSNKDLYETYLPAFRNLVKEGEVYSVMGAYNRFRGDASCANPTLFDILRNKWGFEGYVVSDCGAIADIYQYHKQVETAEEAAAISVIEGTDLNCGSTYKALNKAVKDGLITEDQIDVAVKRLFVARFKLGMFDPQSMVEYAQIPYSVNNSPAHKTLARQAARESIVLLKNQDNLLPLSKSTKKIALIGPNADNVQSLWGNYSGIPKEPVTILKGLENKLSPESNITYLPGSDLAKGVPLVAPIPSIYLQTEDGEQGVVAEYFDNGDLKGEPLYTQIDDKIDFCWDLESPSPQLDDDDFSVRWTGYIVAPETGEYYISDWSKPFMTITIEGEKTGGDSSHHPMVRGKYYSFVKGQKYKLVAEYKNKWGDATAKVIWAKPQKNMQEKAVELAKQSDVVVLALGLNERLEGEEMSVHIEGFEGGDRTALNLPIEQRELMKAVVATGKPVVLVLINGSALSINWASDNIPAIITAGYPGEEGGNAIADVLFGDYNPAGRLPITYYKSVNDLPPFEDYSMENRTYKYFTGEPLYPFGHGLSYTKFSYSNLKATPMQNSNEINIKVDITNTGNFDGDEVAQVYLSDLKASTPRPIRALIDFKRINLKKGETKTIEFNVPARQLSLINKKSERVLEPGEFKIVVGGKQEGFKGLADSPSTETISTKLKLNKAWKQSFDL